jgi:hypothetical protein
MKHPLTFLLRIGRSAHERAPLLGDLEEECRARLARGSNHPAVFVWYTAEILRAFFWGLRDAIRAFVRRFADLRAVSMLSPSDLTLSLRLLIRSPGLTVVSTVGITVGIAIASAMFGYIHSNFDPAIPLDEGDRLVSLENWDTAGNNENRHSLHDFITWRDQMYVRHRDQRISRGQRDDAGGRLRA